MLSRCCSFPVEAKRGRDIWVTPYVSDVETTQQHVDFLNNLGIPDVLWIIGSQLSEINRRGVLLAMNRSRVVAGAGS